MSSYTVEYPDDFPAYAWEVEAKGWLPGVVVEAGGKRYRVTFYDPIRLAEDIEGEVGNGGFFLEPNLVVVSKVTPELMEAAVGEIVNSGRLAEMLPE